MSWMYPLASAERVIGLDLLAGWWGPEVNYVQMPDPYV